MLTQTYTYEHLYYSLWEIAQRYRSFIQFRVIGKSHDDRMIPMIEIGTGEKALFCISGINGTDAVTPFYFLEMIKEYCYAYECGWQLREFYDVKELLLKARLCFIPVLNPDGYEIGRLGFSAVRNPIYRQMLRMQEIPAEEFELNARGVDIVGNFPTSYYKRKWMLQEPASENETKALIRIFQEYESIGMLTFFRCGKKILYYRHGLSHAYNQKNYRLARHLQKCSHYVLERQFSENAKEFGKKGENAGSPEQFYAEICKQPAIRIEVPDMAETEGVQDIRTQREYKEVHTLPLEYLFSVNG